MNFRFERHRARFVRRGVFDTSPTADRVVERVVKPSLGGSSEVDDARLVELFGEHSRELRRAVVARTVALPGGRAYLRRLLAAELRRGRAASARGTASGALHDLVARLAASRREDVSSALL